MSDTEDYAIMIRTTNLTRNDFENNLKYVSKDVYEFFKKSKIYGGEIIMNKIGSAGKFWIMPKLGKPVSLGLNQFVIRLKNINLIYFYHFLSTEFSRVNIDSKLNGVTTKSITKNSVRELPIFVPPLKLQEEFADLVKLINRLNLTGLITYSESLQRSLAQKIFIY